MMVINKQETTVFLVFIGKKILPSTVDILGNIINLVNKKIFESVSLFSELILC